MKRLILAFAAIAAASAFADRVVMKSGSVLTGSGAVIAGDKVKFTSDDLGDVELPADKVAFVGRGEEGRGLGAAARGEAAGDMARLDQRRLRERPRQHL